MNKATIVISLLIAVVSGQTEPAIDQVLQSSFRASSSSARQASNGAFLVDNGQAVITELDIAKLLPCKSTGLSVARSSADVPFDSPSEPADGTWQDISVSSRSDAPSCGFSGRKKRNIFTSGGTWDTFNIPYTIVRSDYSQDELNNIQAAFDEYETQTCIKFIERTTESSRYFRIIRDTGCWSYVGYASSRDPQPLSLGRGCAGSKAIPIHELYHLLGSWHQQSRPDRDTYITINYNNIATGREHNFDIQSDSDQYRTPYSYRSVMHYSKTAFSSNGLNTITTDDPAFIDIIGKSPTFSFVDLQALHRHFECDVRAYNCPANNPCTEDQYRGKDCKCYCKNDHVDANNPAIVCSTITTCTRANQACDCSTNPSTACNGVPNSSCHQSSNECRCDAPYVATDGVCEMPQACDTLGVACSCSSDPLNACSALPNSECNLNTNKCECVEDYFPRRIGATKTCTATPSCRRANQVCRCHLQGADACNRISGSYCDTDTKACKCFPYFTANGRRCTKNCQPLYISNGASVAPFRMTGLDSSEFRVREGDEPAEGDMFGLESNGYKLVATGTGSQRAVLNVPRLTKDRNLRDISVCIEYNVKMMNAVFGIDYRLKGRNEWRSIELAIDGSGGWGTPSTETFNIRKPRNFQLRFRATGNPNSADSNWKVEIDPLIVRRCDCAMTPA